MLIALIWLSAEVEKTEKKLETWSVGSQLHGQGLCKPCAWFWRPGSCQRGADCLSDISIERATRLPEVSIVTPAQRALCSRGDST